MAEIRGLNGHNLEAQVQGPPSESEDDRGPGYKSPSTLRPEWPVCHEAWSRRMICQDKLAGHIETLSRNPARDSPV